MIETTYPYESTSPGVARHQCSECGKWERSDKGAIRHSRNCDSQNELPAASTSSNELRAFGSNVRKYALTKGRTEDVLAAVRAGYLSESDAMNSDD